MKTKLLLGIALMLFALGMGTILYSLSLFSQMNFSTQNLPADPYSEDEKAYNCFFPRHLYEQSKNEKYYQKFLIESYKKYTKN